MHIELPIYFIQMHQSAEIRCPPANIHTWFRVLLLLLMIIKFFGLFSWPASHKYTWQWLSVSHGVVVRLFVWENQLLWTWWPWSPVSCKSSSASADPSGVTSDHPAATAASILTSTPSHTSRVLGCLSHMTRVFVPVISTSISVCDTEYHFLL